MKQFLFFITSSLLTCAVTVAQNEQRLITRTGHAKIYSHTIAEDISANNYEVSGAINKANGEVVISLPVQSFQFEKTLMQEHFNSSNFMDSKQFPKITFKGKIDNYSAAALIQGGKFDLTVTGDITIKGTSKPLTAKAIILINGNKITVHTVFMVDQIGSFGVGKPKGSKKHNVADDIEVTYDAVYE